MAKPHERFSQTGFDIASRTSTGLDDDALPKRASGMENPPKLSFACPLPWQNMTGNERAKSCSQCGHSVQNLSLLDRQQRLALLEQAKNERVCGSYYLRLSGELVTPAKPLSRRERNTVKQFGVAALSAGALALAAGCVAPHDKAGGNPTATIPAPGKSIADGGTDEKKVGDEETIVLLFMGIIACDPPKASGKNGPPSKRW